MKDGGTKPDGGELDLSTIALLHLGCQQCRGIGRALATVIVFLTCEHGAYTYQSYCKTHWEGWRDLIDRKRGERIESVTIDPKDGTPPHRCTKVEWVGREFVPVPRVRLNEDLNAVHRSGEILIEVSTRRG